MGLILHVCHSLWRAVGTSGRRLLGAAHGPPTPQSGRHGMSGIGHQAHAIALNLHTATLAKIEIPGFGP